LKLAKLASGLTDIFKAPATAVLWLFGVLLQALFHGTPQSAHLPTVLLFLLLDEM
jgi:hypothetical protein